MSESSSIDLRDGTSDTSQKSELEYFNLLERIVKGAEYLGNPLIKPEEYERVLPGYDRLCQQAMEMRKSLG